MYPLPNFKRHCWGWGALTGTNTIIAHALLPALGKQKENSTPWENENKKSSTLPDTASTRQGRARLPRLTALRQQRHRQPHTHTLAQPPVPLASLSLASPGGVTAASAHGGTLPWPAQAVNPPMACRKRGFLLLGLPVAFKDH